MNLSLWSWLDVRTGALPGPLPQPPCSQRLCLLGHVPPPLPAAGCRLGAPAGAPLSLCYHLVVPFSRSLPPNLFNRGFHSLELQAKLQRLGRDASGQRA